MADPTPTDPKPDEAKTDTEELGQARPHHKDKGTVVRTAFGQPMSGALSDIADGDD
jgi:hypothetical protein